MAERPGAGRPGWTDAIQLHDLPFCLGNDLVFQHYDIAGDKFLSLMLQCGQEQSCEGRSGKNIFFQRKRNDAQPSRVRSGVVLSI
jgi:hypothetical protein